MTYHKNGYKKTVLLLILFSCLLTAETVKKEIRRCVTGYMTDLQNWVDESGNLTSYVDRDSELDLSGLRNPMSQITFHLQTHTAHNRIRYFSMANCGLLKIPAVFSLKDNRGRDLAGTLEYITFYGNNFSTTESTMDYQVIRNTTEEKIYIIKRFKIPGMSDWEIGFRGTNFTNLLELDLRACEIQYLTTYYFYRMPKLKMLYLSENKIYYIEGNTFSGLKSLRHLDLSRNYAVDKMNKTVGFIFENENEFRGTRLESLDFSFSHFGQRNMQIIQGLKTLKRLSLCYSGLTRLRSRSFDGTSLRILDISGNRDILHSSRILRGLEGTLQVLYAEEVGMKNMDCLLNLTNLEIAQLRRNEIVAISTTIAESLIKLQILDIGFNRFLSWLTARFSLMANLKLLLLNNNDINIISPDMVEDLKNLSYVGLFQNVLVCSCHLRDLYENSNRNEMLQRDKLLKVINNNNDDYIHFDKAFNDFNRFIFNRQNTSFCFNKSMEDYYLRPQAIGNYVLLIQESDTNSFRCLMASQGKAENIDRITFCGTLRRESELYERVDSEWNTLYLLFLPLGILPALIFIYIYRRNFRYFLITMRNTTMLSLISKDEVLNEATIFNYDAFISYCNEDRNWVLDHFLPHVERDCNISVCLHERDFQVGLSILENIVSCMDRSRSIVLIISKKFLLSQWCQFEMHLAQHRLLETRREDLILVLLEEIPRRLRPNTLHYLMVTKTYIVWPNEESDHNLFWKKIKKSIVTLKWKHSGNESLA